MEKFGETGSDCAEYSLENIIGDNIYFAFRIIHVSIKV